MKFRRIRPAGRCCAWIVAVCCQSLVLSPQPAGAETNDDFNVGVQFFKQERWDASARSLRKFLTAAPRSPQAPLARMYLGQSLLQQRKFNEGRDVFREYVKLHADGPDVALARYRVGECSYFLQDDDAAVGELDDYTQRHPGHELVTQAQLYQGKSQLRLNEPAAAIKTLEDLIARKPDPKLLADAEFTLARAAQAAGDAATAVSIFEKFADDSESRYAPEAGFQLGTIAFQTQDYDRAAKRFQSVVKGFPTYGKASTAALYAGFAEYSRGGFPAALDYFHQAAADPVQSAEARMWIGLTHKQAGQFDEAIPVLRSEYERDPEQPLAEKLLYHWADCNLRSGDFGEAQRLFATVADRWPDGDRGDDSLHLATEAALAAEDLDAAQQYHARFEASYPDSALQWPQRVLAGRIHAARGDVLRQADNSDPAAREQYQQAVELFRSVLDESEVVSTRQMARLRLAGVYEKLDENEKVIETLAPIVEGYQSGQGDPEVVSGLLVQAHALNNAARYTDAAAVAEVYLAQSETADPATALTELALARTHLQDGPAAKNALERLTSLEDSDEQAAQASYRCAEVAYAAENWDLASELYQSATAFEAAGDLQSLALYGLGYSRFKASQFDAAADAFATLLEKTPSNNRRMDADAAHMRGLSLQLAGRTDDAIAAYLEGLKQFAPAADQPVAEDEIPPVYDSYRCGKGAARLLRENHRVDDADAAYAGAYAALKALPEDKQTELAKLINEWALLFYEHQLYQRSDELFRRLVEQCPDSDLTDDARLYLGESQFFADNLDEAGMVFSQLVGDEQADDFVRHRASLLLLDIAAQREQWTNLLQEADRFLQQFPESSERAFARYRAAEAALQTEQLDRAIQELKTLKDLQDDPATEAEWYSSTYVLLGEAYYRAKDYPAVEATVSEFRKRFPTSDLIYRADEILGRSYLKRGMFAEARAAFDKVVNSQTGRRTKTAAKAQFHIAESWLIEKDYATALTEYYKVYVNYKIPEWQAPALFQAGQCDESQENAGGAAKSYDLLIDEFPESEYADKARQRLAEMRGSTQ